jgi:hypothetical protein
MSKVKRRSIESQSSLASEETGFRPPKIAIFEGILGKKGWRSGIRVTRAL